MLKPVVIVAALTGCVLASTRAAAVDLNLSGSLGTSTVISSDFMNIQEGGGYALALDATFATTPGFEFGFAGNFSQHTFDVSAMNHAQNWTGESSLTGWMVGPTLTLSKGGRSYRFFARLAYLVGAYDYLLTTRSQTITADADNVSTTTELSASLNSRGAEGGLGLRVGKEIGAVIELRERHETVELVAPTLIVSNKVNGETQPLDTQVEALRASYTELSGRRYGQSFRTILLGGYLSF